MKKNLFAVFGTLILLTIFYIPSACALEIGVQARYWIPTLEGNLRMDDGGISGTKVDIKDDLGISNENIPGVEAFFTIGNHEITASYSLIDLSGDKHIDKTIIFDGDTYSVSSHVKSEMTISMIDAEYQYKFLNLENVLAGFSLGIIGKIKYLDGEVRMRSSEHDNQKDIQVPVPMLGFGAKVGLLADILDARVKAVGMGYNGSFFYDAMADVSLKPFPFLNIHGGYRIMSLKIEDIGDVYAKMDFNGPYVGLALEF